MSDSRQGGMQAEINITPLADVMLVLLIIFMITTPLTAHRIKPSLPSTQQEAESAPNKAVTADLAIRLDGALFLDDEPIDERNLAAALRAHAAPDGTLDLRLRADRRVHYGTIRDVLKIATATGVTHLDFITHANGRAGHE